MAALVPIVDMLNHSPTSQITYFTDLKEGRFCLKTRTGVSKGVQAFNNYGLRSNEKLLLSYGFVSKDEIPRLPVGYWRIILWIRSILKLHGQQMTKQERSVSLSCYNAFISSQVRSCYAADRSRSLSCGGKVSYSC